MLVCAEIDDSVDGGLHPVCFGGNGGGSTRLILQSGVAFRFGGPRDVFPLFRCFYLRRCFWKQIGGFKSGHLEGCDGEVLDTGLEDENRKKVLQPHDELP